MAEQRARTDERHKAGIGYSYEVALLMTPALKVSAGVRWTGIKAPMGKVLDTAPIAFQRFGYDCWLTSCVRDGDGSSKHDTGEACDFDASSSVPEAAGHEIARTEKVMLGEGYDVLWHGPPWHLHVEWDPK